MTDPEQAKIGSASSLNGCVCRLSDLALLMIRVGHHPAGRRAHDPAHGARNRCQRCALELWTTQTGGHAGPACSAREGPLRRCRRLVQCVLRGSSHRPLTRASDATCFANDLRWLSRLPCPIREFADPVNKKELLPEEQASNAPNEVMRLIAWLMSNALEEVREFPSARSSAHIRGRRRVYSSRLEILRQCSPSARYVCGFLQCSD